MKPIGTVRKIDHLGRIVIPKELRNQLEMPERSSIEIFADEESVILKKYKPNKQCAVTGEISESNEDFYGIVLSSNGAKKLITELEDKYIGE